MSSAHETHQIAGGMHHDVPQAKLDSNFKHYALGAQAQDSKEVEKVARWLWQKKKKNKRKAGINARLFPKLYDYQHFVTFGIFHKDYIHYIILNN